MELPTIDKKTITDLVAIGKTQALSASGGRLNDFSPGSPVSAILEAVAVECNTVLNEVNSLAVTLERNRLSILGLARRQSLAATGTLIVRLAGLYSEPFVLSAGFQVAIAGIAFQTQLDLIIPPFVGEGKVSIVALSPGLRGNLSRNTAVASQPLSKVQNIYLAEDTKDGEDEEPQQIFLDRVYGDIRSRDTLISEQDFANALIKTLGIGSTALAIGRLKDLSTYANGYVTVFGLNADGSALTDAQMQSLTKDFSSKVAIATVNVASMHLHKVDVDAIMATRSGSSASAIATNAINVIKAYFKPGLLPAGVPVYPKAIEARLQQIEGVLSGVVDVKLNGFAMPASLKHKWSVPQLTTVKVAITSEDGKGGDLIFVG